MFSVNVKATSQQPHYDTIFRGIRTLRHFVAHVETLPAGSKIIFVIGDSSKFSRTWQLKKLNEADIDKLRNSPLGTSHLIEWNNLVSELNIEDIFTKSLEKLKKILEAAETL